jgi:hypothetical protein
VYKPLNSDYHQEATTYVHNHSQAYINKSNFRRLFSASCSKISTLDSALEEFKCVRFYPCNPKDISDYDFLSSALYMKGYPETENCISTTLNQRETVPLASLGPSSAEVPTGLGTFTVESRHKKYITFFRNHASLGNKHPGNREKQARHRLTSDSNSEARLP